MEGANSSRGERRAAPRGDGGKTKRSSQEPQHGPARKRGAGTACAPHSAWPDRRAGGAGRGRRGCASLTSAVYEIFKLRSPFETGTQGLCLSMPLPPSSGNFSLVFKGEVLAHRDGKLLLFSPKVLEWQVKPPYLL